MEEEAYASSEEKTQKDAPGCFNFLTSGQSK